MELEMYRRYSQMARGIEKAELVFKNGRVFSSGTGEFIDGDVAVADGIVIGVGTYEGETEIDLEGKVICPGFIDSHLHLESTLVTPGELVRQAAQCGTTTFIVDPHESANVSGTDGIDYILDQTEDAPANVYVMMPSCVPATHVDDNGCILTAGKMKGYLEHPRILGLGEVMDAPSVINGSVAMHEKLQLFQDKVKDGHAPFLTPGDLAAYVLGGIDTDHECVDYEYAMAEARNGMQVLIREGSAARNLDAIVKGIVEHHTDTSSFCFCTDDKHIEEIRKEGHINYNVKRAVQLGLPVEKALQMATIQPARCYGLYRLGMIAPGRQADFVILDNVTDLNVVDVYHCGKKIIKDEKAELKPCPPYLKNTVHVSGFSEERLKLKHPGTKARVKGAMMTRKRRNKILKMAKGYWGAKSKHFKMANEQVMKSLTYAYVGRKQKKRNFRQLWITRISAACKMNGMNYSNFMHGLKLAGVEINRKMLAEMAVNDKAAFTALTELSKAKLA